MDKKSRELVMGKLYFKNKDYKMAEKSFLDYLTTNPEDFQALKLLAQVYEHLKNFSKAFDLYERCYLVEPDRKGVILDLCRLLVMNEPSLSRVDQHKWLQLGLQVFPANPIVLSLKSSLPAHEPKQNKAPLDNAILEKLCSIEKRLASIENKMVNIGGKIVDVENKMVDVENKMGDLKITSHQSPAPAPKPRAASPKPRTQPISKPVVTTPAQVAAPPAPAPDPKPKESIFKPAEPSYVFGSSSFSSPKSSPQVFKTEATQPVALNLGITKTTPPKPAADVVADKPAPLTFGGGFSGFGSGFSGTNSVFGSTTQTAAPTSLFGSTTETGTPNLFSQAMLKLNMPTETPWLNGGASSTAKNDDQGDQEEGGDEDNGDDRVPVEELPIENTCDLEAIEIKTGEEDEEILFEERCKLYRFRDKEYKERGLGQIKVLRHKETGNGRIIMRRELINKVCLNCWTVSKIEQVGDNKTRFAGMDASDGEPEMTVLLAKFKKEEQNSTFISHLRSLFPPED